MEMLQAKMQLQIINKAEKVMMKKVIAVINALTMKRFEFVTNMHSSKITELVIHAEEDLLSDCIPLLVKEGHVDSKNEFLFLLSRGAIRINNEIINSEEIHRVLFCGDIIELGRWKFTKIIK